MIIGGIVLVRFLVLEGRFRMSSRVAVVVSYRNGNVLATNADLPASIRAYCGVIMSGPWQGFNMDSRSRSGELLASGTPEVRAFPPYRGC